MIRYTRDEVAAEFDKADARAQVYHRHVAGRLPFRPEDAEAWASLRESLYLVVADLSEGTLEPHDAREIAGETAARILRLRGSQ